MKKLFAFALIAVLLASGLILSCSNASGSSANGATSMPQTVVDSDVLTEADIQNVKAIVESIKSLTETSTIKATGKMNASSINEISAALRELAARDKNILVTLDLSEVTGVKELSGRSNYHTGAGTFYDCVNLVGIVLPNTLEDINIGVFSGCTKLKSVSIPNSVKFIGDIFSGCVALEEITLPCAFNYFCKIFGDAKYDGAVPVKPDGAGIYDSPYYMPPFLKDVKITGGVIGILSFQNCKTIMNLTISDVSAIGSYAFSGCSSLADVTVGNGVTNIGGNAFSGCSNLTSLTISNSVARIGEKAFSGCSSLASLTIPRGVTSIGAEAFKSCGNLSNVNYTGTIAQWCKIKFSDSKSNPFSITKKLCIQGQEITDLIIPNEVERIEDYVFSGIAGVKSVTIPSSVTSIGTGAFGDGLSDANYTGTIAQWCKVKFSDSKSNPFSITKKLRIQGQEITDLIIPNEVERIGDYFFSGIAGLKNVTIPNSVREIGRYAFYGCAGLVSATFSDTNKWYRTSGANYVNATALEAASLADPASAANYLKDEYTYYYWWHIL